MPETLTTCTAGPGAELRFDAPAHVLDDVGGRHNLTSSDAAHVFNARQLVSDLSTAIARTQHDSYMGLSALGARL
jgi:hypothetical protein